jgi:hypothetical protein
VAHGGILDSTGGGERIRTAASRPKQQKQEVIPNAKKPEFPGFFFLGLLPEVCHLKLEHFWNIFLTTNLTPCRVCPFSRLASGFGVVCFLAPRFRFSLGVFGLSHPARSVWNRALSISPVMQALTY